MRACGRGLAAIGAGLVEELPDGAEVRRALRECASDGVIELTGGEAIEQEAQPSSEAADIAAPLGDERDELLAVLTFAGTTNP